MVSLKPVFLLNVNLIHSVLSILVRGAYCAISVASICNILDDDLIKGTPEWISTCQTYEGD